MARHFVITSWGSYGDVYPYVGLAHALRSRGHRVRLAVPEFYRGLVEDEGFEHRPVGPEIDPDDRELITRIVDPVRGS